MNFIRRYIQNKLLERRINQIFSMGNPCNHVHPIKQEYEYFEKQNKGFVAFDFIILDQEVSRDLKPLSEAKFFNAVMQEIKLDPEVKDYKKMAKEINLGQGADWYHVLINGIAENQTLAALANLAIPIALGKWIIETMQKYSKRDAPVKIGPASARMIAFSEVAKQKKFERITVVSESEGANQKKLLDIDYFILMRGEMKELREDGSPVTSNYLIRISSYAEILKVVSLDD